MFGTKSGLKPLESRKRILIAESELNRAQLIRDWETMADEVHALAAEARTLRSMASATVSLVGGLAAWRRKYSAPPAEKPSKLQTVLKSAGLISTLWAAFRAPRPDQNNK